jgi:hypothetical protein
MRDAKIAALRAELNFIHLANVHKRRAGRQEGSSRIFPEATSGSGNQSSIGSA